MRRAGLRAGHGRRSGRRGQVAARRGVLASVEATVVRGRCLSYGEGITYWPVVEVLKQLEPQRSRLELDPAAADGARRAARHGRHVFDGRDRVGVSQAARGGSGRGARRRRLRRHPMGRGRLARSARARGIPLDGRSDPAPLHGAAGAARPAEAAGAACLRCDAARPLDEAEALIERLDSAAASSTRTARADPASSGRKPALRRRDGGDGAASRDNGEVEVPPTLQALLAARLDQLDHAGAARARARRRRRRGVPPRRRPGAGARAPRLHTQLTALVRKELIRPDAAVRRRRCVPLPPPPHPRRRLRGAPEGDASRAARAVRRLARRARHRARRARRARSATTSSRPTATGRSSGIARCASARCPGRRTTRELPGDARSAEVTCEPRSPCSSERPICSPDELRGWTVRDRARAGRASAPDRARRGGVSRFRRSRGARGRRRRPRRRARTAGASAPTT